MQKYYEDKVVFPTIHGHNTKSAFIDIGKGLIFSPYKIQQSMVWRKFIKINISDFSKCYWHALKLDAESNRSRKRKLSTFLKSIYDQKDMDVALIMIKAVSYLIDKLDTVDESRIIETIVKEILPNGGFCKNIEHGRYVWNKDDRKKFKTIIGKAFVLNYINSNFNKDAVWKYVKKYCFMKDGVWNYKDAKSKRVIRNSILSYLKIGGILKEEKVSKEFTAFIPLAVLRKNVSGSGKFFKEVGDDGHPFITGIASNTKVDRDEERVSESFIKKMQETAVGLPILINSHHPKSIDETIGVVKSSGGDANNFEINAMLEKPEDNELVKKVINKMDMGIIYGYSIGGRITKAFREFDEDLQKEIIVLADGELYHILLTNQPANADTFAESVAKSFSKDSKKEIPATLYEFKHSSKLAKEVVSEDDIDLSELPDAAFPINHSNKEVCKDYAHHCVKDSCLYLHKDLLVKSYRKALSDEAPDFVTNHLVTHLQVIGLSKQVDDLNNLIEKIDTIDDVKDLVDSLVSELKPFFKAIDSVKTLDSSIDNKKSMLKNVMSDVSTKIVTILNNIEIED